MKNSAYRVLFEFEGGIKVYGELSRVYAPFTVSRLVSSLPLNGRVEALKGWLYFTVEVSLRPEKPKFICEPGWIGYWPLAKAICLFYEEISLTSPVNRVGSIINSSRLLADIPSGIRVTIRLV